MLLDADTLAQGASSQEVLGYSISMLSHIQPHLLRSNFNGYIFPQSYTRVLRMFWISGVAITRYNSLEGLLKIIRNIHQTDSLVSKMIPDGLQLAGQAHITRVMEKYWESQDSHHILELL